MFIESQSFKPLLKALKSSLLTVQKTSKKKNARIHCFKKARHSIGPIFAKKLTEFE